LNPTPANSGVATIRFANLKDGWAYGAELWATHDGGSSWKRVSLPGAVPGSQIMALEAKSGTVHAVVQGANAKFLIETSPAGGDDWTPAATELPIGAGPDPTVQIVLWGPTGWVLENDRTVVAGARLAGTWEPWQPPCLTTGGPAALTASSPTDLAVVCDENIWGGAGPIRERGYASSDGGSSFQALPAQPPAVVGSSAIVTSPGPRTLVLAAYTQGGGAPVLVATFDGGATWGSVAQYPGPGRWLELGFTSPTQGVAVTYQSAGQNGTLRMTYDGGHTWNAVTFRQA
jgi:hypothetical protein